MSNYINDETGKMDIAQVGKWHQSFGLSEEDADKFNSYFANLSPGELHTVSRVLTHVWLSGFGRGVESKV